MALSIVQALRDLADAYEAAGKPTIVPTEPVAELQARQAAVLAEVAAAPKGRVHFTEMNEIAVRHGYSTQGMAGFYSTHAGLMKVQGEFRMITPKGRKRLGELQGLVAA